MDITDIITAVTRTLSNPKKTNKKVAVPEKLKQTCKLNTTKLCSVALATLKHWEISYLTHCRTWNLPRITNNSKVILSITCHLAKSHAFSAQWGRNWTAPRHPLPPCTTLMSSDLDWVWSPCTCSLHSPPFSTFLIPGSLPFMDSCNLELPEGPGQWGPPAGERRYFLSAEPEARPRLHPPKWWQTFLDGASWDSKERNQKYWGDQAIAFIKGAYIVP